jgi:pimeloyl-ACP methyl ester carboxylesterase
MRHTRTVGGAAVCIVLVLTIAAHASAQALEDRYLDVGGTRIRYVVAGTGQPIVLVHGLTRSIETNWMNPGVFWNLAKDHRVIAMDLRGHGKSDKPHDAAAYKDTALDVIRLLDELKIARAHIVGYSIGGAVVAKLMTTHPQRVLTATLGGHSGLRDWDAETADGIEERAAVFLTDVPFRLLVARAPDGTARTEPEIREASAILATEADPKAMRAFYQSLRGLFTTTEETKAVRVPVLAVIGSRDTGVNNVKRLPALLPKIEVVIIEGATHAGEASAPRRPEFVEAIRRFVAAHRAPVE